MSGERREGKRRGEERRGEEREEEEESGSFFESLGLLESCLLLGGKWIETETETETETKWHGYLGGK